MITVELESAKVANQLKAVSGEAEAIFREALNTIIGALGIDFEAAFQRENVVASESVSEKISQSEVMAQQLQGLNSWR